MPDLSMVARSAAKSSSTNFSNAGQARAGRDRQHFTGKPAGAGRVMGLDATVRLPLVQNKGSGGF
jgi:hypothetical protein